MAPHDPAAWPGQLAALLTGCVGKPTKNRNLFSGSIVQLGVVQKAVEMLELVPAQLQLLSPQASHGTH